MAFIACGANQPENNIYGVSGSVGCLSIDGQTETEPSSGWVIECDSASIYANQNTHYCISGGLAYQISTDSTGGTWPTITPAEATQLVGLALVPLVVAWGFRQIYKLLWR
jgi:hypothetical protein